MKDRQNVFVTVESVQDGERTVRKYKGELFRKEASVYIRYAETDDLNGQVRTVIRLKGGELSVTRRGGVESEQYFAAGAVRAGRYRSAHLSFPLETKTTALSMSEKAPGELPMTLTWSYELRADGRHVGRFRLRLDIQEE
ncbi:DUF1934 domain-containing protein [Paenibacillus cisolokensis]|jgi:uncharacterized beta-barrel protein YwiB (DUF1934 family)|uniref:DUF1934 domain-containing protein n=1 Tax=Paenibacillus cisolokensis TaxID=1658519 RepID=A0ABQ4NBL9_9BACL|nr:MULTISPECIES: DUF1934 domain-containing protein [Paenibacillus]ALS25659.1 hypothetical protein IJ21_02150 [Paenibacillus sp. 32O-W]GIQ65624.1 hypothetical protein PACILC2_41920 [Paenibacillus cisolokensis]